jgi:hypothetical protein
MQFNAGNVSELSFNWLKAFDNKDLFTHINSLPKNISKMHHTDFGQWLLYLE